MNPNSVAPRLRAPRGWCKPAAAAVTMLALLTSAALAQTPLTLEDALQLAQARSLQLPAQDSAAQAAREMGRAAGALPDPTLKAGVNNLPINGEDRFSLTRESETMRSIGLMQEFTRADKRRARAARFEREADAAAAARLVALAGLQRDTAQAWLERHYAERMREVLAALRDEARLQIDAADAAYRGARGMQADVFAARAAVAQIEDRIAQNDGALAVAQARLARWIGEAAARPLAPPPELSADPHETQRPESWIAHHPQMALLARQEDVARAEADVAASNKRADWSVELMYSQRGPAYSNMISINVSIPLQWDQKNRQDRELAAALAKAEQARAEREEVTREHIAETGAWMQQWRSNRERIRRYRDTLVPLAADRMRAALAAYRGGMGAGGGTLSAVLEARRMQIDTQMEQLRIEMETAALWAQLNYAIPAETPARGQGTGTKEQTR